MATATNGIATYDDIDAMYSSGGVGSVSDITQCVPYSSVTAKTFAYVTSTTTYSASQLVKYEDLGKITITPNRSGSYITTTNGLGTAKLLSVSENSNIIANIAIGGATANSASTRSGICIVPFNINTGRDDVVWGGSNGTLATKTGSAFSNKEFTVNDGNLSGGTISISITKTRPNTSVAVGDFYVKIEWSGCKYKYPDFSHPYEAFYPYITKMYITDVLDCYDGGQEYIVKITAYRG